MLAAQRGVRRRTASQWQAPNSRECRKRCSGWRRCRTRDVCATSSVVVGVGDSDGDDSVFASESEIGAFACALNRLVAAVCAAALVCLHHRRRQRRRAPPRRRQRRAWSAPAWRGCSRWRIRRRTSAPAASARTSSRHCRGDRRGTGSGRENAWPNPLWSSSRPVVVATAATPPSPETLRNDMS